MLQRGGLAVLTSSILLPGDLLYCSQHTLRLPLRKKRGEGCLKCSDKKIYRSTLENSPSSKFFPEFLCDKLVKKASNKRGHSSPWTCYHNDQMSSWCHGGTGGGRGGGGGGKCDCKMPPTPKSILISPLKLDILKITEDYSKVRCAFILNKKETHGGREKNFNAITLF